MALRPFPVAGSKGFVKKGRAILIESPVGLSPRAASGGRAGGAGVRAQKAGWDGSWLVLTASRFADSRLGYRRVKLFALPVAASLHARA